jgi:hypothetical protein
MSTFEATSCPAVSVVLPVVKRSAAIFAWVALGRHGGRRDSQEKCSSKDTVSSARAMRRLQVEAPPQSLRLIRVFIFYIYSICIQTKSFYICCAADLNQGLPRQLIFIFLQGSVNLSTVQFMFGDWSAHDA